MEHRKQGRKLKRTASHRKALLSNLCISLIKHKRITTTLAKAKELRRFIEPLLTKSKKATKSSEAYVHYAREIRKFLKDKEAINILLKEIAPKVLNRNGGYTRVLKSGYRIGDGGEKAIIEFVDFGVVEKAKTETKTAKTSENATKKKTSKPEEKNTEEVKKKPAKKETVKKDTKKAAKTEKAEKTEKTVKKEKPEKTEKKPAAKKTTTRKKKEE